MQILYIHVCECKNVTVETIPVMEEGIKESRGRVNSNMIYLIILKTSVNFTIYLHSAKQ
jgi:hypothetical protein